MSPKLRHTCAELRNVTSRNRDSRRRGNMESQLLKWWIFLIFRQAFNIRDRVPHDCERSNTSKVPFCFLISETGMFFERSSASKNSVILTEGNESTRRKICSTATLSTINFTRTVLASNTDLRTDINPLAPELFFLTLAHPVYKMWIIQEPNKLALWNKLHFEEREKKTESVEHV